MAHTRTLVLFTNKIRSTQIKPVLHLETQVRNTHARCKYVWPFVSQSVWWLLDVQVGTAN